jgi:hypothetical protein
LRAGVSVADFSQSLSRDELPRCADNVRHEWRIAVLVEIDPLDPPM